MSGYLEIKLPESQGVVTATIENVALMAPGGPQPTIQPPLTLYSQRDPRWKDLVYAGGQTFGEAGCFVTCVAMVASLAGSCEEPPQVAEELERVGCFSEAYLDRPELIPQAYPGLRYDGTHKWHDTHADTDLFFDALREGPVITEVDFRPTTREFNQHFVVALEWDEVRNDLLIADPWDGQRAYLLERYRLAWYALAEVKRFESAICGVRLLRVV